MSLVHCAHMQYDLSPSSIICGLTCDLSAAVACVQVREQAAGLPDRGQGDAEVTDTLAGRRQQRAGGGVLLAGLLLPPRPGSL